MGTSPRVRPAKMTDILRTAFGFKEGSHITIAKTKVEVAHAARITLNDVTPAEFGGGAEPDDNCWTYRAAGLLIDVEALAIGITIEVSKKKGLKKRFFIDHVESKVQPGVPALFFIDDNTQIIISEPSQHVEQSASNAEGDLLQLDTSGIGGLVEHVKELNRHLDHVLHRSAQAANERCLNKHIVLHGFEGTGKTLLLDCIERHVAATAKVSRLSLCDLAGSPTSKIISKLDRVFEQAAAARSQPCVVLLDDLTDWLAGDNLACVDRLGKALDKVAGSHVLAIATTRAINDLNGRLIGRTRFSKLIELPIPDSAARKAVLAAELGPGAELSVCEVFAEKTHGFTGKDLSLLVEAAFGHLSHRQGSDREEWVQVHARMSLLDGSTNGQADGSVHSQATTEVENTTQHSTSDVAISPSLIGITPSIEDFEFALTKVGPTALRQVFLEKPKVLWSDIGGSDVMKQLFDEIIGWPLKHAEVLKQRDLESQKGVLLYGPPGCSKTLTAQAVATTYDLNFIAVKGAELISMYVGESERAVREVFRKAKLAAPCIVFFDEIDAIGSERDSQKGLHVLTTLLNEMDGFETMKDVLVLAATNKPESLDPALIRAGRFDSHIYVGPPNGDARREILNLCLKSEALGALNMNKLVTTTDGYSGAEIVRLSRAAKTSAVRRQLAGGDGNLTERDFTAALTPKSITEAMLKGYEAFANRS